MGKIGKNIAWSELNELHFYYMLALEDFESHTAGGCSGNFIIVGQLQELVYKDNNHHGHQNLSMYGGLYKLCK